MVHGPKKLRTTDLGERGRSLSCLEAPQVMAFFCFFGQKNTHA